MHPASGSDPRPRRAAWRCALLAGAILASALGCNSGGGGGSGGGPPTDPGSSLRMSLTADQAEIGLFDNVRLLAVTRDQNGMLRAGVEVRFSTDFGTLDRSVAQTNDRGEAEARLRGDGVAGLATVTARVGTTSTAATAQVRVVAPERLEIAVLPAAIAPTGSSRIDVTTRDARGAFEAGVSVRVETSLGRLASNALRTDGAGRAATELRGTGLVGVAELEVRREDTGDRVSAQIEIGLGRTVTLLTAADQIPSNGSTQLDAVVREVDGSAPPRNLAVNLETNLGRLQTTLARTDRDGVATTRLFADGAVGTATVIASAPGAEATSNVKVRFAAPYVLTVRAQPTQIAAGGEAIVTALLATPQGAPGPRGSELRFGSTLGTMSPDTAFSGSDGTVTSTLRGGGVPGRALVTVDAPGLGLQARVEVVLSP